MTRILLSGCNGKMGQTIADIAQSTEGLEISAGFDIDNSLTYDFPVFTDIFSCNAEYDVIVDFSHPSVLDSIIRFSIQMDKPVVIATTGFSNKQKKHIENASMRIPVFLSANMSLGVNLLLKLVRQAAEALIDSFDIEIIEKHHNRKVDAPSGTALLIADSLNDALGGNMKYIFDRHSMRRKRSTSEIGIHAVRGGTITGDHSVIFAGNDETLEIKHTAQSRNIFASGALKAAAFMHGKKPGLYTMNDLLTLN